MLVGLWKVGAGRNVVWKDNQQSETMCKYGQKNTDNEKYRTKKGVGGPA